ncbi:TIGR02186 family protein [Roseovarius sp. SCSIO 43702]|uniref:TIGR02186 family protein n=1 Tax=Roseovarius sp. SCSIO 43702 TaxID=2823043 RepID=UPI001C73D028|nr:TIGR02186 family protein [Roseovarius sp. SCSIO 43702]QYX57649.1 TIGR02186 family protein [Roseovarius sp. SCSIO 43702]
MRRVLSLLAVLIALPAGAEEVVLGLSRDKVAITATFDGSEILIFGAVKREEPIREDAPLDVVVTVSGPTQPVVVRRKERVAGIWVNTESIEIDGAPSFYAVASSGPLREVLSEGEDLRNQITLGRAIRSAGALHEFKDTRAYTSALIRIRQRSGAYKVREGGVLFDEQTLFRTSISMPANLTEGVYLARIFLTREGQVVTEYDAFIEVGKVGIEQWLYALAHERPFWYGIMSLAIAIVAGWGASAVFRVIGRG